MYYGSPQNLLRRLLRRSLRYITDITEFLLRILRTFFDLNELRAKTDKVENSPNSFQTSANMVNLNLLRVEENFEHKHAPIRTTCLNFHFWAQFWVAKVAP